MKKTVLVIILVILTALMFVGCNDYYNIDITLQNIKVTTKPTNVQIVGEPLDTNGMVVTGYYNNNFTSLISEYTVTPATLTTAGEEVPVTISYQGKTDTINVEVVENTIKSICVKTAPKILYSVGDELDLSALVIEATYLNGDIADITSLCTSSIADGEELEALDSTVTFTYGEESVDLNIYVIEGESTTVTLNDIEVVNLPVNKQYKGTTFDKTGMVVCGVYTIGDKTIKSVISNYTVSPATAFSDVAASTPVTVSYTEGTVTKTKTFNVEVLPAFPTKIELEGTPSALTFNDFDNTEFKTKDMNIKIKVTYNDGTQEIVDYEITEDEPKSFILYSPTISDGVVVKNTNNPDPETHQTDDTVSHLFNIYYTEGGVTLTESFQYPMTVYDKMDYMMKGGIDDNWEYLEWFNGFGLEWDYENKSVIEIEFVKQKPKDFEVVKTLLSPTNLVNGEDYTESDGKIMGYLEKPDSSKEEYKVWIVGEHFTGNPNCIEMFGYFESLTKISGLELFDTSIVETMNDMFGGSKKLKSLDLSSWDTSNVTDMGCMFGSCTGLKSVNLSGLDTSNLSIMNTMFYCCSNLEELDISSFDTSSVTDMSEMFCYCSSLETLNLIGFDIKTTKNRTAVPDTDNIFYNCDSLEKIYIDSTQENDWKNASAKLQNWTSGSDSTGSYLKVEQSL